MQFGAASWQRALPPGGVRLRLGGAYVQRRPGAASVIVGVVALALAYLVGAPLFTLLLASLRSTQNSLPFDPGPLTLANFSTILGSPHTYQVLGNTLIFAGGSLAVGGLLGTLFAWLIERTDIPFRGALGTLLIVPLGIPPILTAISYVYILDPRIGILNAVLRAMLGLSGDGPLSVYTLPSMFVVQGLVTVPTLYLMVAAAFRSMDPALEEAAQMSGASWPVTTLRVTLPLMSPALLAAAVLYVVFIFEAFEIPGAIGLRNGLTVFSTEVYNATYPVGLTLPDYGRASALSVVVLLVALVLLAVYFRATRRTGSFTTITGRGYRPLRIRLGAWRYPAVAVLALYLALSVVLVPAILLWVSVQPFYAVPSPAALAKVSLQAYAAALAYPEIGATLANTVILGVGTATATIAVTFGVAWIVVRSKISGRRFFDAIAMLPQAIPGVVIGLAMLFLHLGLKIPLYGTVAIIVVGLTSKYLAFGTRTISAAYIQLHVELEEAASLNGASLGASLRRVTLPLLKPALLNAWIWIFLHAIRELPVSVMLYAPGSVVLATLIWHLWQAGQTAVAGALGVVLFAVSFAVSLLMRAMTRSPLESAGNLD